MVSNKQKRKHKKQKNVEEESITENAEEYNEDPQQNKTEYEDNSDTEDQPKRKKKKKPVVPTEANGKKGAKSIRQMKREKHAQRLAEEAAASQGQTKSECLSYLSSWKHNRQNWKFNKVKQMWIFRHKFSIDLIPDSIWPVFLEYFEGAKGNVRSSLLEDSNKVISEMEAWKEFQAKTDNEETEEPKKPDDKVYKRARDIIQSLAE